jgi:hypothetical protein
LRRHSPRNESGGGGCTFQLKRRCQFETVIALHVGLVAHRQFPLLSEIAQNTP